MLGNLADRPYVLIWKSLLTNVLPTPTGQPSSTGLLLHCAWLGNQQGYPFPPRSSRGLVNLDIQRFPELQFIEDLLVDLEVRLIQTDSSLKARYTCSNEITGHQAGVEFRLLGGVAMMMMPFRFAARILSLPRGSSLQQFRPSLNTSQSLPPIPGASTNLT